MIKRSYEISDEAYSYFSKKAAEEDRPIIKYISRMLEQIADSQKATAKPRAKKVVDQANKIESAFNQVWEMYEKKGNRKTSLAKWSKLSIESMQLIFDHIPHYVRSTPDKQFRKNFETYINQEGWLDEITERARSGPKLSATEAAKQHLRQRNFSETHESDGRTLANDDRSLF